MAEKEYISREEIFKFPVRLNHYDVEALRNFIDNIPAADVVPVIRCKDCIFREFLDSDYGGYCCDMVKREVQLDDYCSFGKRRTDND